MMNNGNYITDEGVVEQKDTVGNCFTIFSYMLGFVLVVLGILTLLFSY